MCRPHSGPDSPGSSRPDEIRLARPDSSWPEGPEGPDSWPDSWPEIWPEGPDSWPEEPDGPDRPETGPDSWPDEAVSARLARSLSSAGQLLPAAAAAGGAEKRSSSDEGRSEAIAPGVMFAATSTGASCTWPRGSCPAAAAPVIISQHTTSCSTKPSAQASREGSASPKPPLVLNPPAAGPAVARVPAVGLALVGLPGPAAAAAAVGSTASRRWVSPGSSTATTDSACSADRRSGRQPNQALQYK
jgi:hypothetical protein